MSWLCALSRQGAGVGAAGASAVSWQCAWWRLGAGAVLVLVLGAGCWVLGAVCWCCELAVRVVVTDYGYAKRDAQMFLERMHTP